MPRPRLEIKINDAVGQKKFTRLNNLFASPMPTLQGPVRALVRDAMRQQFESEGRYGGEPWQELAERTIKERIAEGFDGEHPILRRNDILYDAFQGKMNAGVGGKMEVRKKEFTLRIIGLPQAQAHQKGLEPHLPARPIIPEPMPDDFIRKLRSIVSGYIVKAKF